MSGGWCARWPPILASLSVAVDAGPLQGCWSDCLGCSRCCVCCPVCCGGFCFQNGFSCFTSWFRCIPAVIASPEYSTSMLWHGPTVVLLRDWRGRLCLLQCGSHLPQSPPSYPLNAPHNQPNPPIHVSPGRTTASPMGTITTHTGWQTAAAAVQSYNTRLEMLVRARIDAAQTAVL